MEEKARKMKGKGRKSAGKNASVLRRKRKKADVKNAGRGQRE
jgi:hypothetical protein